MKDGKREGKDKRGNAGKRKEIKVKKKTGRGDETREIRREKAKGGEGDETRREEKKAEERKKEKKGRKRKQLTGD